LADLRLPPDVVLAAAKGYVSKTTAAGGGYGCPAALILMEG
jgi:hypothetical protein